MLETLQKLSKNFELILFSEGSREIHHKIMSKIDPENELFSFKLYKEQCYQTEKGVFVKDLRVLNRPFCNTVLVDNSTSAFGFQLNNGVPIIPFTGDASDTELLLLAEYLENLLDVPDVCAVNRAHFRFQDYVGCESMEAVYKRVFKKTD